jgi:hypothetical protein
MPRVSAPRPRTTIIRIRDRRLSSAPKRPCLDALLAEGSTDRARSWRSALALGREGNGLGGDRRVRADIAERPSRNRMCRAARFGGTRRQIQRDSRQGARPSMTFTTLLTNRRRLGRAEATHTLVERLLSRARPIRASTTCLTVEIRALEDARFRPSRPRGRRATDRNLDHHGTRPVPVGSASCIPSSRPGGPPTVTVLLSAPYRPRRRAAHRLRLTGLRMSTRSDRPIAIQSPCTSYVASYSARDRSSSAARSASCRAFATAYCHACQGPS